MSRFWKVIAWLWATGWAALGLFAAVDRGTAVTNIGSWIEPLDGVLGPNTDLWLKIIAGAMIASPFLFWWFMGWRERMKDERKRKAASAIPEAIRPPPEGGSARPRMKVTLSNVHVADASEEGMLIRGVDLDADNISAKRTGKQGIRIEGSEDKER
jgi:hypothetical protein